jgi:hypothetical protein
VRISSSVMLYSTAYISLLGCPDNCPAIAAAASAAWAGRHAVFDPSQVDEFGGNRNLRRMRLD